MKQNISCISIYTNSQESLRAIDALLAADCDIQNISIMAKQKCCEGVDDFLKLSSSFEVAEIGLLNLAGNMANLLNNELIFDTFDNLNLQVNQLQKLLFIIGVPAANINEYEQAVKDNKILLLVHGNQQEVEYACETLHSEIQQVTVHRA